MKIDAKQPELQALVAKMGARQIEWSSRWSSPERRALLEELETRGVDFGDIAKIEVTPEGFLTYENELVVLYIRDVKTDAATARSKPEDLRRFHIFDCVTLDTMRKEKRFDRYVASSRKDGFFTIDARNWKTKSVETMDAQLLVCKNCLGALNYEGFACATRSARDKLWRGFSIKEFFEENLAWFSSLPRYSDRDAPPSDYVEEWPAISLRVRSNTGWKCDECSIVLADRGLRRFLHVHHINGVAGDNRPANLRALCVECHAAQAGHGRMAAAFKAEIEKLRRIRRRTRHKTQ